MSEKIRTTEVRYFGCSNFAAWQLMKSLSVSEKYLLEKFVVYQGYSSLIGHVYEQELMPLLKDQGVGLMVVSPDIWRPTKFMTDLTAESKSDSCIKIINVTPG